jgi:hypothetical protein
MTTAEILRQRLYRQQLIDHNLQTPEDVVRWLGAVQAQDYNNALWGVGQRLTNSSEEAVEQAIERKAIVRTWPLRGTLHFAPAEDVRWMLKYLAPRVIQRMASITRKAGLDAATFKKSAKVFERVLRDGQQLTRTELYEALEKSKIDTGNVRGLHILGQLAQEGLVCFGPHRGKQPTITLLDEYLPASKIPPQDEAMAKLARSYFQSHGPATLKDFAWWAGLNLTEATRAFESIKQDFVSDTVDDRVLWRSPDKIPAGKGVPKDAFLMSVYDEYGISYKDRSDLSGPKITVPIINTILVVRGKVVGTWKRTEGKDHVAVEVTPPLATFSKADQASIKAAAKRYGKFLGKPALMDQAPAAVKRAGAKKNLKKN